MNYDFKTIETTVEKIWEKNKKQIDKSLEFDPKKPLFSFLEGPPTANAPPALHHMEARVYKDIMPRYKFMKGFTVPRIGGWDCHGLPVEVQVEKQLKLKTKKDVLKYGVENFNSACRKSVFSHIQEWTDFTKKMAFWVNAENPYITMENQYIESVWWSLKEMYKKKLLYEGFKVVPWCPRCETPLSSHEVSQGYEDVTEVSITTKFRIRGTNRFLIGWTTTPWTVPGNVALAVNPKLTYVVVKKGDEEYVLAKGRVAEYFENPNIVGEFKGEKLNGIEYEPLFNFFIGKLDKPAWKVVMVDYATEEEGTGIVHTAPAFGEEDYDTIKKYDMAFIQHVTKDGKFTDDTENLSGLTIWEANKRIIEDLDTRGLLFRQEQNTHSYPHCWRCKTPLLYYATDSWFIAMSKFRKQLIDNNKKINWFPDHIKDGRFGKWLEEVKDWALSRNKFWGTPLPIWKCECGEEECIGSIEELQSKSISNISNLDIHKPFVDKIKLKCRCGKSMERVSDVIDCWYDSGSAAFAQFHYPFENKELFEKRFPYDFIAEAIDQTRGWFYTLHAISTVLFNKPAYKNVVCAGHLLDENGRKMSKSIGNVISPWDIFQEYGVDAARLLMCTSAPGNSKKVGRKTIEVSVIPFLTILWNSHLLTKQIQHTNKKAEKKRLEDTWLLSKANSLITKIETNIEKNEYQTCYSDLQNFTINDLSRWYLKIVKNRNDTDVTKTLLEVFKILSKVSAPFIPYFSEFIYSDLLKNKNSVHLSKWQEANKKSIDISLEKEMEIIQSLVESSNSMRVDNNIKLKYPLQSLIIHTAPNTEKSIKKLEPVLLQIANVKEIIFKKLKSGKLEVKLNYKVAGKKYGRDVKEIATLLKNVKEIKPKIKVGKFNLDKRDLDVRELGGEGKPFSEGRVMIDLKVSDELKEEWLLRELTRAIQEKRKELKLTVSDKIKLTLEPVFKNYKKQLEEETGSTITFGKLGGKTGEVEFEDKKYKFGVIV